MRRVLLVFTSLVIIGGVAVFLVWYLYKPTYTVGGKITRDGQPLEWKSDTGILDVKFVPLDRERDMNVYRAQETDRKTGTYTIRNVPPGSYRVSIQQQDPDVRFDLLGFEYSTEKSPVLRDVNRDDNTLDIDLAKGRPKKRES